MSAQYWRPYDAVGRKIGYWASSYVMWSFWWNVLRRREFNLSVLKIGSCVVRGDCCGCDEGFEGGGGSYRVGRCKTGEVDYVVSILSVKE